MQGFYLVINVKELADEVVVEVYGSDGPDLLVLLRLVVILPTKLRGWNAQTNSNNSEIKVNDIVSKCCLVPITGS